MSQQRTLGQAVTGAYTSQPTSVGYGLPQGARVPGAPVTNAGYATSTAQSLYPTNTTSYTTAQPATAGTQIGPSSQYHGPGPVPQQGQTGQPAPAGQTPAKVSDQRPPIPTPAVVLGQSHPMFRTLTGTLVVKPQMGQFDKNYDVIGKMDPYCICQVGASPQQTTVAKGQGQECTWEDALHFPIKGEQFLFVDCLDYDVVGAHDYIGRAQLDLTQILARGHYVNWVPIFDNAQKKVGQVYLSVDMVTSGVNPNLPANYVPHQGPVSNVLQHSFGDWARIHPGYQYQPGSLNSGVSTYGGASSYGSVPTYGAQAHHVPSTQIGGYSHVVGPQVHAQNGYSTGGSPYNGTYAPARF